MESIAGMKPTGRRISGPASELVELDSESGLKHTAICFQEAWWDHPGITSSLTVVLGFLESPMVTGLLEMSERDRDSGTFIYPTGTVWSVAEVIRTMAHAGRVPGIRAGLELCYVAGQVIMEAAETGPDQGIYSHGGLTPWRLMLKADGQVQIIGYGLPQVEVLQYLEDPSMMPREDSFRYCPPERLEGQPEDVTSDLFALALIGLEMMVGKPVYDGLVEDILQKATRAEGAYTLHKWREKLPDSVREVLGRAIKFDPDTRYDDPNEFVHDVHDILSSFDAEGPSLMEVMETVRRAPKRGRALMGGQTAAISKEELKRLAEEVDDAKGRAVAPPTRPRSEPGEKSEDGQPRWAKVSRRGRRGEDEDGSSGAKREGRGSEAPAGRGRLRRGRGEAEGESRGRLRRSRDEGKNTDTDRSRLRERLRSSRDGGADEPESPRDRLKRGRGESGKGRARLRAPDAEPAAEAESASRRPDRPRRRGDKEKEAQEEGAAALLAKLRASGGVASKPESGAKALDAPPPKAEPKPPAQSPPVVAPAPAPAPAEAVDDSARGELVSAPPTLAVSVGGTRLDLPVWGSTVSEAVAHWCVALGLPADMEGRLTGWYRLQQAGIPVKGDASVDQLDHEIDAELVFVPNTRVMVTVEVAGEPPTRFRTFVGMAVPARAIVGQLRGLLELPEADWALWADGLQLGPDQTLGEAAPEVSVISVRC